MSETTCSYCGRCGVPLLPDCVIPVSQGGGTTPDNLTAACRECNAAKGSMNETFDLPASALVPKPAFVANGARLKIVANGHETIVRVEDSRVEGHTLILTVTRENDDWPA